MMTSWMQRLLMMTSWMLTTLANDDVMDAKAGVTFSGAPTGTPIPLVTTAYCVLRTAHCALRTAHCSLSYATLLSLRARLPLRCQCVKANLEQSQRARLPLRCQCVKANLEQSQRARLPLRCGSPVLSIEARPQRHHLPLNAAHH